MHRTFAIGSGPTDIQAIVRPTGDPFGTIASAWSPNVDEIEHSRLFVEVVRSVCDELNGCIRGTSTGPPRSAAFQ